MADKMALERAEQWDPQKAAMMAQKSVVGTDCFLVDRLVCWWAAR